MRVNVPLLFTAVLPPVEKGDKRCLPWGKMGGGRECIPQGRYPSASFRGTRLLSGGSLFCPEVVFDGELQLGELNRLLVPGMCPGLIEIAHSG